MSGIVLGIHSNVTSGSYSGGHAWISVTKNGASTHYGLWPDSHPSTDDNGPSSDIRVNLERMSQAKASRYYSLNDTQETKLSDLISQNITWGYTHNCSSWSHDIVWKVVGEDVDADDGVWFIETPRELGRHIQLLEQKNPTSITKPSAVNNNASSSSWF